MSSSDRLRLVYVVTTLNPGGTEKLVRDMAIEVSRDMDVQVLCLDEPGVWAPMLRARGITVQCLWRQPGLDLALPGKIAAACKAWQADILHAHQCTPWFYAALSRLLYRRPRLIFEEHGRFYPETDSLLRRLVNRWVIGPLTHHTVAVSQDIAERLVKHEGLRRGGIEVIPNGALPEEPMSPLEREALRQSLGIAPGDCVLGTVGRLDPIKNLPLFLNALAVLRATQPTVRAVLVGDGPERQRVRDTVAALGLQDVVVLTGFREDARRLVQALDVFVLTSFSEGTSMALLEAMSVGVPAVVTAVGGNPEVVLDGETGWLLPSDDGPALVAALSAATDAGLRRARGLAAKTRFEANYSFSRMMDRYRNLYQGGHPS